jgi:hypothetical protein
MFWKYHHSQKKQLRCSATLRRAHQCAAWQSDFCGLISDLDGRLYRVGLYILTDAIGEQILRIYLQPLWLLKSPITSQFDPRISTDKYPGDPDCAHHTL